MKNHTLMFALATLLAASLACKGALQDEDPFGFDLGDQVWEDVNADGIQDPDEPGVAGVRVLLVDANTGELISFTDTDTAGKYTFLIEVPRENLLIEFHPPAGYFITKKDAGANDETDSDADPGTGQTDSFNWGSRNDLTRDAGLIREFAPPSTPTPTTPSAVPADATPTTEGSTSVVITTTTSSGGCDITYTGPSEAQRGQPLMVDFSVVCNGEPGSGRFFATLGDPPSDPNATHANGDLDALGMIALTLDVNWPGDMTTLFCSYEGEVYPVTTMRLFP